MTAARKQEPRIGPYVLKHLLGKGGTAQVFLVWKDNPTGEPCVCALKMPSLRYVKDEAALKRFLREAVLGLRLGTHPNIVSVIDAGQHGGMPYIVMQYVDGVDLATLLKRARKRGHPLSSASIHHILHSLGQGLHHAHSSGLKAGQPLQIIHRDVTPGNVLVTRHGEVKLMDFGIGVAMEDGTTGNHWRGTARYMSPQHLDCAVCPEMDIYSLGVIAWELVENRVFREELTEPKQFWPAILDGVVPSMHHEDRQLVDLIMSCLAFEPRQRPSAAEFCEALTACQRQRGSSTVLEREMSMLLQRQWSSGASQRYLAANPELTATLAVVEQGNGGGRRGADEDDTVDDGPGGREQDAPRHFRKRKASSTPKAGAGPANGETTTKSLGPKSPLLHPVADAEVSSTATTNKYKPKPGKRPSKGPEAARASKARARHESAPRKAPEARPASSPANKPAGRLAREPWREPAGGTLQRLGANPFVVMGWAVVATLLTLLCARWFGMVEPPARTHAPHPAAPEPSPADRRAD